MTQREITDTITDGIRYGSQRPRRLADSTGPCTNSIDELSRARLVALARQDGVGQPVYLRCNTRRRKDPLGAGRIVRARHSRRSARGHRRNGRRLSER